MKSAMKKVTAMKTATALESLMVVPAEMKSVIAILKKQLK